LHYFRSFGKGEVTTKGDETKDVKVLETSGDKGPIDEPIYEEVPATSTKPITKEVVTSRVVPTESVTGKVSDTGVASIEAVAAAEGSPIKTVLSEVTDTEFDITLASTPPSNDHNISLGDHFSYIVSDHLDFAETPDLVALSVEPSHEEVAIPPVFDPTMLNVIYHSIVHHHTSSAADLPLSMESVPSSMPVP